MIIGIYVESYELTSRPRGQDVGTCACLLPVAAKSRSIFAFCIPYPISLSWAYAQTAEPSVGWGQSMVKPTGDSSGAALKRSLAGAGVIIPGEKRDTPFANRRTKKTQALLICRSQCHLSPPPES